MGITQDVQSGTFVCRHAGWELLLSAASQTGGTLSPQAVFEQGVMEMAEEGSDVCLRLC